MSTITANVADYATRQWQQDLPDKVAHETKRLLLNNLASSAAACDHEVVPALLSWVGAASGTPRDATVFWHPQRLASEQAAFINAVQMELIDFNETHLGVVLHPTSIIAPAALAEGEVHGRSGKDVLKALAIGIEIEIALAAALRPSAHSRGVMLLAPGGAGAATAAWLLGQRNGTHLAEAVGLGLTTGSGVWENLGSLAHPYSVGCACRDGVAAAYLAEQGVDVPGSVFEGWQGMLRAYSDETVEKATGIIAALGDRWELLAVNYKTLPTETITQAPLQCLLPLARATSGSSRAAVAEIDVIVSPRVAEVEQHRYERFGLPTTGLQAQFDLRYCVAAGWLAADFGPAQKLASAISDKQVLDLRERVKLVGDPSVSLHDGARVRVKLADGQELTAAVEHFHGTPGDPLTDDEIVAKFVKATDPVVASPGERVALAEQILDLQRFGDVGDVTRLLARPLGG